MNSRRLVGSTNQAELSSDQVALIFKKYFTVKITLISMIKKISLTFLDVKN